MSTTATTLDREQVQVAKEESQLSVVWRRFRKHKLAMVGLATITLLLLFSFTSPFWTPYDPTIPGINAGVQPYANPGYTNASNGDYYLLGTDVIGRDVLSRLAYGGMVSLSVGLLCTILVALIGTIVGALSGFYGGWVDSVLMRIVDILLSLPFLPILLALSVVLGPGYWTIVISLTALGWGGTSRLVRGSVLSLRNLDFVEATRALGASNSRIITRHLLPNSLAPIIVDATLNVGGFIVAESSVSFLGFGISEPTSSWGNILSGLEEVASRTPLQLIWPGLLIFLTVLSINFIGDALRDALDPRLKMLSTHRQTMRDAPTSASHSAKVTAHNTIGAPLLKAISHRSLALSYLLAYRYWQTHLFLLAQPPICILVNGKSAKLAIILQYLDFGS